MTTESTDELPVGVASRTIDGEGVIRFRNDAGQRHNPVGPAVIHPDRATFWLVTGRNPELKPDWWFGYRSWWLHGQLHRIDGPAIIRGNGTYVYWVNDRVLTEEQFYLRYSAAVGLATKDQA